jgi:hypothetical protein
MCLKHRDYRSQLDIGRISPRAFRFLGNEVSFFRVFCCSTCRKRRRGAHIFGAVWLEHTKGANYGAVCDNIWNYNSRELSGVNTRHDVEVTSLLSLSPVRLFSGEEKKNIEIR